MLTRKVKRFITTMIFLGPFIGLGVGINQTEYAPAKGHALRWLFGIISSFPQKPVLWYWTGGGLIIACVIGGIIAKFFSTVFTGAAFKKHLRGTKLVSSDQLARITRDNKLRQITIGGVPMPTKLETLHTLVGGSTGTGKTVIFKEMEYTALLRGDRTVTCDPNGEFMQCFFKPGDIILNPYDARTEGWSIFNEIRHSYDFKNVAESVVAKGKTDEQEEWNGYARLLFSETARKLAFMGRPDIKEVFRWCTLAQPDDLKDFLAGTDAESLFVGAEKALASARFVLGKYLPEHINMPAGDFSIRDWLDDPKAGNIWITWREDQASSLRPLVSAWIDTLARAILSLEPSRSAEAIWLFLDELDSLEKLPYLRPLLTKGRKHGARVVAGLQASSQIDDTYGEKEAITLRACFRNLVALGGARPDPDTPEFFSKALGEHEVMRDDETDSSQRSSREKHEKERIVLASEITSLPDLEGFVGFAGDMPVGRINLTPRNFRKQTETFVERSPYEIHSAHMGGIEAEVY